MNAPPDCLSSGDRAARSSSSCRRDRRRVGIGIAVSCPWCRRRRCARSSACSAKWTEAALEADAELAASGASHRALLIGRVLLRRPTIAPTPAISAPVPRRSRGGSGSARRATTRDLAVAVPAVRRRAAREPPPATARARGAASRDSAARARRPRSSSCCPGCSRARGRASRTDRPIAQRFGMTARWRHVASRRRRTGWRPAVRPARISPGACAYASEAASRGAQRATIEAHAWLAYFHGVVPAQAQEMARRRPIARTRHLSR